MYRVKTRYRVSSTRSHVTTSFQIVSSNPSVFNIMPKRSRHPAPKAPKSAWHFFMKRHRDQVSATHAGLKATMREYSRLHKLAPRDELVECQRLENRARRKWAKELVIWNAEPRSAAEEGSARKEPRRGKNPKPVPPMRIIHHDVQYIDREGRDYTVSVPYEAATDEESDGTAVTDDPPLSESWSGAASSSEAHRHGARSASGRSATGRPTAWLKREAAAESATDDFFTSDDESESTGAGDVNDAPAARGAAAVDGLDSASADESGDDDLTMYAHDA